MLNYYKFCLEGNLYVSDKKPLTIIYYTLKKLQKSVWYFVFIYYIYMQFYFLAYLKDRILLFEISVSDSE